ncbi:S24 family peptidase [Streptomyces sp. NPDC001941]|uniref:S24 family peptidase n=1 Tax=Streptomyces sp. NPDC001941 TaxID=3154659 RepID=UPI0033230541
MGLLEAMAVRVSAGETVEFRPSGHSMTPLIRDRQQVRVSPALPATLERGDIVLARVAGTVYLHLVSAVDHANRRVQISNNQGRTNGWTSHDKVFGICVAVEGTERRRVTGKVRVTSA